MINNLEFTSIHANVDEDLKKYARKKISKLDAYMPKHARKSANAEIKIQESKVKNKRQFTAEVTIKLPGEVITAKETTVNMYAAIDIVEEKLKAQLRRYKSINTKKSGRRRASIRNFLGKITRKK